MIGEKLGHYEITAKIGKGGMGVVYRAVDTLIGRDVALKTILLTDIEDPNERQFLKERLFREAKSAGILSHPNIVTVYQIGEQDGLTYIAMEFVDGANLGEILARPQRPGLDFLLSVFEQTAMALDYAHSRGVVHRDIKPGNIIVRDDGVAKIADFGVAKISSQNVTRAGMALGTPHYMSPEQFHGRAIDGRSDQYSLAVMVYEILTGGKKPFTADSIHGLMYKILHEEPQPRRDNPDLSEGVDAALKRALAKEPDQRFPSCTDFVHELRNLSGITPMPFSIESGLRTSSTAYPGGRPTLGTPIPSPVPPVTTRPATPGSGITLPPPAPPGAGLPPPPMPPAPPASMGMDVGRGPSAPIQPDPGGFVPGGAAHTPASGVNVPSGTPPLPPPPASGKDPFRSESTTPAAGTPVAPGAGAPGMGAPGAGTPGLAPPPPGPPQAKAPVPAKAPAPAKGTATKTPAKTGAAAAGQGTPAGKPGSRSPLVLIAVVLVLLLVAGSVVAYLLTRPSAEPETVVDTTPPPAEAPITPEPTQEPEPEPEQAATPAPEQTPTNQAPASPPPQIASFSAEPLTINQGESARLSWATSNTTYVQISPGLPKGRAAGDHTVSPVETTKYTLIAHGYGGRQRRELTVTVVPRQSPQQQPQTGSAKPNAYTLDALIRALESGEDVVPMTNIMVRAGVNGVTFAVTPDAQNAILAAGERGGRQRDAVVRLLDLAKAGGRR